LNLELDAMTPHWSISGNECFGLIQSLPVQHLKQARDKLCQELV
jgi:hypothetical protein